jgi:hypothetical protein
VIGIEDFVKCHEIDIYRIEDQFYRHQNGDQVLPDQKPIYPDEEHDGAGDEKPV